MKKFYSWFLSGALTIAFFSCSNADSKPSSTIDSAQDNSIDYSEVNSPQESQTEQTPIQELFSSMDNLKSNFVGMDYVSSQNNCIIDMRRETRYKIFIKENGEWIQFNGEKYRYTYNEENHLCVEFDHMEENGSDEIATAILTPEKMILKYKNGKSLEYSNFRITTSDEAGSIVEG